MSRLVMVSETFYNDDPTPDIHRSESGWASAEEAVRAWRGRGRKFTPYRNGIEEERVVHGGHDNPDLRVRHRVWFETEGSEPDEQQ